MAESLPSTQSHLEIVDIKDDLLLMRNGNISLILETSSLNFELLAEEEQDARIVAFAALLNSLTFPVQIVVRTERADVNEYIDKLIASRDQHQSKALRKQMEIYIKFIRNLTVKTEVLNKRFFMVLTTNFSIATANTSLLGSIFGSKQETVSPAINLPKAKDYLFPKRDFMIKQFQRIGLKAVQLNNDQLTQLFYDIYDPDKVGVKRVELAKGEYTAELVESQADRGALIDSVVGPAPQS
jgi:type IV secretory pathway VirB4 component